MNINEFISYEDNNQPLFPLFKVELLKDAQIEDLPLNILFPRNNSILFDEDIIFKKIKGEENAIITAKKRGRKAIPKNTRQWNDPNITMKEIIENDLAGAPTEAEIKKNKERVKKIKETKARKKAEREKSTTAAATPIEKANNAYTLALEPIIDLPYAAPQIIFKDGKIIIAQEEEKKELVIVGDKKPYKLNSMSFRTKNHTAKWTLEETGKFYKAIEIFGTDFSLIAKLFPARNRNQIKNKFRKEEKANIKKIDEAINKNSGLAKKRSLMDRIRAFNNNVKTGEFAALANNEVNDELRGFDKLERRLSTASTDGMDLKIMEEIQDIFVKEIRPANNFAGNALGHLDLNLDFEKEDVNEAKNGMIEAGATQEFARIEEGNANKKQNLLLRLFN